MIFNSLEFVLFFSAVLSCFLIVPSRFKWLILLTSSYIYYALWQLHFPLLLLLCTFISYFSALRMDGKHRHLFLIFAVCSNLGLLIYFKYFNFFGNTVNAIFEQINILNRIPAYNVLLPVGISFFTFQTLSYTIDIYKRKQEPEYHFGRFALFVSFFPLSFWKVTE